MSIKHNNQNNNYLSKTVVVFGVFSTPKKTPEPAITIKIYQILVSFNCKIKSCSIIKEVVLTLFHEKSTT